MPSPERLRKTLAFYRRLLMSGAPFCEHHALVALVEELETTAQVTESNGTSVSLKQMLNAAEDVSNITGVAANSNLQSLD